MIQIDLVYELDNLGYDPVDCWTKYMINEMDYWRFFNHLQNTTERWLT